jgi:hypothetical protein
MTDAAAGLHSWAWRRGSRMAARGAGAATGDADDRVSLLPVELDYKIVCAYRLLIQQLRELIRNTLISLK